MNKNSQYCSFCRTNSLKIQTTVVNSIVNCSKGESVNTLFYECQIRCDHCMISRTAYGNSSQDSIDKAFKLWLDRDSGS